MSTPVCIANAVADALGLRDVILPMTPLRLHRQCTAKKTERAHEQTDAQTDARTEA